MGIVVSQSIKNVIITCLGFGLGAVNTLFLFTNFMEEEYYGLVSYLMSASNLIWPLMAFGAQNTLVKFFSSYMDKIQQEKFLSTMLVIPLIITVLLGGVGVFFYQVFVEYFTGKNDVVQPYIWTIFVLAFAMTYFELFFAWSKVQLKTVFGNVMKELFLRTCIFVMLFLVYFEILTVSQFIYGLVISYLLRLVLMGVYAIQLHPIIIRISLPENYVTVFKYTSLILIAGSVATLLIDLDKAMIEYYMPIENVAKYGICAYIASVIIIPSRAMHQITYPLTAKLINEKAFKQLKELYVKSSINLFIASGLLFVLIICNVNQLFGFIPDDYELYIEIILLIGSVKLFDNLLGNNNSILYNSDYYRLVLYLGIGMVIVSLLLNILCIPVFGITGAAIATFGAVCIYNLIKLLIVYRKFKIQPLSKNTALVAILIIVFLFGFYFWEFSFYPIINMALKSLLITIGYVGAIYFFKISSDVNDLLKRYLKK